jgi:hypothetical protein
MELNFKTNGFKFKINKSETREGFISKIKAERYFFVYLPDLTFPLLKVYNIGVF